MPENNDLPTKKEVKNTPNQKPVLLGGLLLILVLVIGFAFGMFFFRLRSYRLAQTIPYGRNFTNFNFGGRGFPGRPSMMMGRGGINGQITGIAGNQVTVQLFDGSTRTINLSGSTTYTKVSQAAQTSLQKGQNISVTGSVAADGTVSAQSVRISGM
jgi:hypothetical protein